MGGLYKLTVDGRHHLIEFLGYAAAYIQHTKQRSRTVVPEHRNALLFGYIYYAAGHIAIAGGHHHRRNILLEVVFKGNSLISFRF
jgi:hypothetical protein